jgi:hypothetical protein
LKGQITAWNYHFLPLVVSNSLAELLSLVCIGDRLVKRTLRETNHLGGNTDAALVENIDGNLSGKSR